MQVFQYVRSFLCFGTERDEPISFQQLQPFEDLRQMREESLNNHDVNLSESNDSPETGTGGTSTPIKNKSNMISEELEECIQLLQNEKNPDKIKELIFNLCFNIPNENIKFEVLSRIVTHFRKTLEKSTIKLLENLITNGIPEEDKRKDLMDVLLYLPSATLGDRAAQEETRVFVNALTETRNAIKLNKKTLQITPELVDLLIRLIISTISNPSFTEEDQLSIIGNLIKSLQSPLSRLNIGNLTFYFFQL